jgi:multidrug efflux pump subunit AcrA (membrane-fusion protein)
MNSEAEIEARIAAALTEQQQQFTAAMQGALAAVDTARAALEQERAALLKEQEAVREQHAEADRDGEAMAREAYEKHRRQYDEAARLELLRTLTRRQVEAGKSTPEIAGWLMVEPDFVDEIRRVVQRVRELRPGEGPPGARVLITTEGRGGTITYLSTETRFDLWWEFGGTALALVDVPTEEEWTARTGLPLQQRRGVLTFIGEEIVARQTTGGSFHIGDNVLTIYTA